MITPLIRYRAYLSRPEVAAQDSVSNPFDFDPSLNEPPERAAAWSAYWDHVAAVRERTGINAQPTPERLQHMQADAARRAWWRKNRENP